MSKCVTYGSGVPPRLLEARSGALYIYFPGRVTSGHTPLPSHHHTRSGIRGERGKRSGAELRIVCRLKKSVFMCLCKGKTSEKLASGATPFWMETFGVAVSDCWISVLSLLSLE